MLMSRLSVISSYQLFLHSLILIPSLSAALRVTPSSKCASICGPDTDQTTADEVVCYDSDFAGTSNGTKFEQCVECELSSTAVDSPDGMTDVLWGIYNLRFALSTCVYGFPQAKTSLSTPCQVSCASLQPAVEFDLQNDTDTSATDLSFCNLQSWSDTVVNNCVFCYNWTTTERYISNFMQALHNACKVSLPAGQPFPISPTQIFSSTQISAPPTSTPTAHSSGLGSKLAVVIAVPTVIGSVALITILVCCTLLVRKRKRMVRAAGNMDRVHAGSWNDPNIPHIYGGHQAYPSPPAWSKNSPSALAGWNQPMSPITNRKSQAGKTGSYYEGWGNTFSPGSPPTQTWPAPRFQNSNPADLKDEQLHERYFGQAAPPSTNPFSPLPPPQDPSQHPDLNLTIPSPTAMKKGQGHNAWDYAFPKPRPRSGDLDYQLQPYSDQSPDKDPDSAATDGEGEDGRRQTFIWDGGKQSWVKEEDAHEHLGVGGGGGGHEQHDADADGEDEEESHAK